MKVLYPASDADTVSVTDSDADADADTPPLFTFNHGNTLDEDAVKEKEKGSA
jgi:hypothetical protein